MALMGMTVEPEILRIGPERLPQMDAQGIDVEALSINPYWYTAERTWRARLSPSRTKNWLSSVPPSRNALWPLPL